MITTHTTFVIGAGASVPYGLPTGKELAKRARKLTPKDAGYQLILSQGVEPGLLSAFLRDLTQHGGESIDEFLEQRQDSPETMKIGRLLIAGLMGEAMARPRQRDQSDDWLAYLLGKMRRGTKDIAQYAERNAGVYFVTFNFDSVLEDRFHEEFSTSFHEGVMLDEMTEDRFHTGRVIHVHGRLPSAPEVPLEHDTLSGFSPGWRQWIAGAASHVHVVHDEIDPKIVSKARDVLNASSIICFLGFAYDRVNLARLDLLSGVRSRTKFYGSAFELPQGEQEVMMGRMPIKIVDEKCSAALKKFAIFKD